ncbi:hypothetical protein N7462_003746 [Penicillium macrosclerotiorum]|uniref:uncharacterized protein n=1 Tax=Penicillium macrosclerotiorum TaxID=303699 RepID=UPI0025478022|nr:uncharacterized protein N7462_003746 [Penicillium macrosclerotiorum]KAJ5689354.1 hypothetical protein N7462_003746 [Penicillium macrosclerotiorum]
MANTGYTSPFPTSHDTIGQSTLVTPLFMPSSPPQQPSSPLTEEPGSPLRAESPISEHFEPEVYNEEQPVNNDKHEQNEKENLSRPSTPGSMTGSDLDARLAEYTLDFSQFPSSKFLDGKESDLLPEMHGGAEDNLSDVGGPEDFTANMEKYLMGEGISSVRKSRLYDSSDLPGSAPRHQSMRSREPVIEQDVESGEMSEFGPPVDMSTPSHLLHRTSALARDSTHLEDIEEDPADELPSPASPSNRQLPTSSHDEAEEREERLRQRIVQLEEELKEKEEHLQKNHKRVLEAASAGEQIRHLQLELQRKSDELEAIQTSRTDESALREQIKSLRKQNDEREKMLQQSAATNPNLSALEQQMRDMQQQIQNRDSQNSLDTERLETIAHLRQQLHLTQEQLQKRDEALDETMAKLREVTRAKEVQLHEGNTEIDRLKAENDHQALENERLETELDRVNADYQALEDRLTTLETRNQPLEERNQSLEADLTRVQSQVEAQENALKAVAADLPISGRSTYSEILDLIKDLGHPNSELDPELPVENEFIESKVPQDPNQEIAKLQHQLQDATAAQKAADAEAGRLREQATETQALIKTIETENSRLTSRVEELTSNLNKTQHELTRTQEEHAESLETVARLQEEALGQPPSPPLSPARNRGVLDTEEPEVAIDAAELEASHQAQIRSLQTAHSTAITTLRSSHAESMRKIRNLLTTAEQREADLRVELTTLRTSVSAQEAHLCKTFKSEIKHLEAVIAAKDETAAAVDERIALSVDKREREWERRVDLLLEERDRMARALMMYWGEKEIGRGPGPLAEGKENRRRDGEKPDIKQGQAYKYKYAQKHRSRNADKNV